MRRVKESVVTVQAELERRWANAWQSNIHVIKYRSTSKPLFAEALMDINNLALELQSGLKRSIASSIVLNIIHTMLSRAFQASVRFASHCLRPQD